ncbi:amidase signature domain-containing protein [Thelonectria olida]|uniref:Amidase signature domain-containing protein n=1 Tax=Thelonectria olida TaxID=1576542 RepID=A0A9P9ANM3_9HYPO|nr:amidase signature domain-containing protein [Thelonectria olida]
MSIVSLTGDARSSIDIARLRRWANDIGFEITDAADAEDYLLLLRSLEAVLESIKESPDYIDPSLEPCPTTEPRTYWRPAAEDNPLNAWSHRCSLRASSCTSNLLSGKTIAIKDNISVGGLPTTLGTFPEMLSGNGTFPISPIDASVVSRVLAAGAVIKGSATCESFCASPLSFTSATGPVHQPLLRGHTSGGSSSGCCALVAASVLPQEVREPLGETCQLAIGSDQAGSVRIPACFNGIYGLKPTRGLVPYTGAASMAPMIDHLGPIASNLEDIAALLKVTAGYDGLDSRMTPESPLIHQVKNYPRILADFREGLLNHDHPGRRMRIGMLKESFTLPGVSAEVRDTVQKATTTFFKLAGAEVVTLSIPLHLDGPSIWTASTRPSMSEWLCQGKPSGYLSYLPPHLRPKWPPTQETYELLNSSNPAVINIMLSGKLVHEESGTGVEAKAHRKVLELRAAYDRAFEGVDILVTPCAPTIAMPHPPSKNDRGEKCGVLDRLKVAVGLTNNTCPFNVTGHPAMSVPCGFLPAAGHEEVKLPVGMQIIGKRWDDESVILAAALFEEGRRLDTTEALTRQLEAR